MVLGQPSRPCLDVAAATAMDMKTPLVAAPAAIATKASHGIRSAQPTDFSSPQAGMLAGCAAFAGALTGVARSHRSRLSQGRRVNSRQRCGYTGQAAGTRLRVLSQEIGVAAPSTTTSGAFTETQARPAPLACPVCQKSVGVPDSLGSTCKRCRLIFIRQPDGNFIDFTLQSAQPIEDGRRASAAPAAKKESSGFLRKLPFVAEADGVAEALGLPQSRDIEALGRELLKEPQRLLSVPLQPPGTSTFQNPLVSFVYERGWRQSFAASGFPGPDEEFGLAQGFLSQGAGLKGDVLLDASCGSGLFSRRFVASGQYGTVVALDFSESMLRQVNEFAQKELGDGFEQPRVGGTSLTLLRADIARLPFQSNSLGGVHAGAAIHCWPSPENAVAEVARVLRPGGVFVLSTFRPRGPLQRLGQRGNPYRFWEEAELHELTRRCGLTNFQAITRDPAFIMVCVRKPALEE